MDKDRWNRGNGRGVWGVGGNQQKGRAGDPGLAVNLQGPGKNEQRAKIENGIVKKTFSLNIMLQLWYFREILFLQRASESQIFAQKMAKNAYF